MLLDGFDVAALSLAAPFIMSEWSISRSSFGLVFGSAQAGILVGALVLGHLADRLGRRPTIIAAVGIFGMLTLATPFTVNLPQLALVRFLGGIALGGIKPVVYSLNVESAPRRMRSLVVAIAYSGFSIGQIVSGFAMAALAGGSGWRLLFVIGGTAPVAVAAALFFGLPESLRFLTRDVDSADRPKHRARLEKQIRRLTVVPPGAGIETLPIIDEVALTGHHHDLDPRRLFAGPLAILTPLIWMTEILAVFVSGFYTYWTPTLARLIGASQERASHALAALALGAMVGPLLLTGIMDRFGRKWVVLGPASATVFLALLGANILTSSTLLPGIFVVGMLVLGVQMSLGSLYFQIYPTQLRTYAMGWCILVGGLGSVSSPILAGHLIDAGLRPDGLFLISAAVMACIVPMTMVVTRLAEKTVFARDRGGPLPA